MSAELAGGRWRWNEEAVSWLRTEVFGGHEPPPGAGATDVMVVGDRETGKTTLVIRLLGVTEPAALDEAGYVLRAGSAGNAPPIRYRWSDDAEKWTVIRDGRPPFRLGPDEMHGEIAALRTTAVRGLAWDPRARPFEVGLPTRLAGAATGTGLRVLDLPGVRPDSPAEQDAAQVMIARYAPVMSLVLLVANAGDLTGLDADAVRESPNLYRFRIVLTRAFENAGVRRLVAGAPSPAGIALAVRTYLAGELAGTFEPALPVEGLIPAVFPIDLGASWNELQNVDADYRALVTPARDLIVDQLIDSLAEVGDEEHRRAPEQAIRLAERLRRGAGRRTGELAELDRERRQAVDECARAETELAAAQNRLDRVVRSEFRATAEFRAASKFRAAAELRAAEIRRRRTDRGGTAVSARTRGRLRSAATRPTDSGTGPVDQMRYLRDAAERVRDRWRAEVDDAATLLAVARQEHEEATARETAQRATAATLRTLLNDEHRAYVGDLARRAQHAPPTQRGWYAVAALQAVLDLNRMLAT